MRPINIKTTFSKADKGQIQQAIQGVYHETSNPVYSAVDVPVAAITANQSFSFFATPNGQATGGFADTNIEKPNEIPFLLMLLQGISVGIHTVATQATPSTLA